MVKPILLSFFVLPLYVAAAASSTEVLPEQSLYLGEQKTIVVPLQSGVTHWTIERQELESFEGASVIGITAATTEDGDLKIDLQAPYISPSFTKVPVTVVGARANQAPLRFEMELSVRAELVIRLRASDRKPPKGGFDKTPFEWDVPVQSETGKYQELVVNNHPRGIWVRFLWAGDTPPPRKGGQLMHIYRGEGEYIVHQPFDPDFYLTRSDCPFEPISEEEWKTPSAALTPEGKSWANCEFRGFVPPGMAYGFGYREHYDEKEVHEKRVTIANTGALNTDLIEFYLEQEKLGLEVPLDAMCSSWD